MVADALRVAAKRVGSSGRLAVQRMADKVMEMACEGDMAAINFVTDRLDGKLTHSVNADVAAGPSDLFLELLTRVSRGVD
jgi:hypothetical protein